MLTSFAENPDNDVQLNSVITSGFCRSKIKVRNFQALIDNQYTHHFRLGMDNDATNLSDVEDNQRKINDSAIQLNLHVNKDVQLRKDRFQVLPDNYV